MTITPIIANLTRGTGILKVVLFTPLGTGKPMMTCTRTLLSFLLLLSLALPAAGQGGPPGATIADLTVAIDDTSLLYAATDRGVFLSTTAGETWVAKNDGLPALGILRVAASRDLAVVAAGQNGVYRSRGGGKWEVAMTGIEGQLILSVEMDPSDARILYAGAASGQIFKSLDAGDRWTSVAAGLADGSYFEITVSPLDPDLVFASNLSADQATGRLFRTTNGGTVWTEVVSAPALFAGVDFSLSAPGTAWIATSTGLLKTEDSGGTFTGPFLTQTAFQDVAIDPLDAQVVYAGSRGNLVLKSSDGGQNWAAAGTGLPRATVARLVITPQALYAGLAGSGVFRSHDGGQSWTGGLGGMLAADVLAISAGSDGSLLASTTGGAMFRAPNGGALWAESRTGLSTFQVTSMRRDPATAGAVYAGTINPLGSGDGSLLFSGDGGRSWRTLFTRLPVFSIATHPSDGKTVYAGTPADQFTGASGLLRSTDAGASFQVVNGASGELFFQDVIAIEFDPANPSNLYLIARGPFSVPITYRFFRSTNAGVDWATSILTTTPIVGITIDPADPRHIFLASVNGMSRSIDGGVNFTPLTGGLPNGGALPVSSIAADCGALYAATSDGVYKSTDSGDNWALTNTGHENVGVRSLRTAADSSGAVYAATNGAGVYITNDHGATWLPSGGVPELSSRGVVNAATFHNSAVSPGEIVSLFGQNAGPANGVQAGLDPQTGKLPTSLGGVRVFFDDILASLFFVRADQLNVQAPFEIAGRGNVRVHVEYQSVPSSWVKVAVKPTHPGVFAPVLNQDFTLNSAENPALRGSVVQLFVTGQGAVSPPAESGLPAPSAPPLPAPAAPVTASIGGEPVTVEFAGLAPGLVGLLQVNVHLPGNRTGELEIAISIGGVESPARAVVFVN